MFWAINKITNQRVNSITMEFSEEFCKIEEWFADPTEIKECPKEIDITKIKVKYRKLSKKIINEKGTIYRISPHFFIPNAEKLGIITHPNMKEHTKAINLILNLLKDRKLIIKFSEINKPFKYDNSLSFDYSFFDFNKLDIEVNIKNKTWKRVDILLPLKDFHPLIGFGIAIEIQLSKQSDELLLERGFERASKGYSICWLKPNDFKDIESDNLVLIEDYLEVVDFNTILKEYKEKTVNEIKEITINYSSMIEEKINYMEQLANKIIYPLFKKCPKCEGLLSQKKGTYGEFYGCSNYPNCRYTIKIR